MTLELNQPLGNFLDIVPPCHEFLTLNFSLNAPHRTQRWRNYGLSADFLGEYFSSFFPGGETKAEINTHDTVKASVGYLANELIENAVKYGDSSVKIPVSITLRLYEEKIIFEASNPASVKNCTTYQAFIQRLLVSEPMELYMAQLEKSAQGGGESHIGLLSMINDYEASFGWQFSAIADTKDVILVSVMAHLPINI